MNKRELQIAFALLCLCAAFPVLWLAAIDWIQFDERAVGENSPYYDDVVNRPAKQIYAIYTTEHYEDGTHKALSGMVADSVFQMEHNIDGTHSTAYLTSGDLTGYVTSGDLSAYATTSALNSYMSIAAYDADADGRPDMAEALTDGSLSVLPSEAWNHINNASQHFIISDGSTSASNAWSSSKISAEIAAAMGSVSVSEYALTGTGAGNLASGTSGILDWFSAPDVFSIYGVVMVDQLARAESFYQYVENNYSTNLMNFGKTADNRLQVTIGANTYTSGVVWTADTIGMPIEVGVVCNRIGGQVYFSFNGATEAAQAATYSYPATTGTHTHTLGAGLDGAIFFLSISGRAVFAASGIHTPLSEGLSQCPACKVQYDMDAGSGSILFDRYIERVGGIAVNLTVAGTWQEYARGY